MLASIPKTFSKLVIADFQQWLENLSVDDLDFEDVVALEDIAESLIDLGKEYWGAEEESLDEDEPLSQTQLEPNSPCSEPKTP